MSNLRESIEHVLPTLEEIREGIIQVEATDANRIALDRAYATVAHAIHALEALRRNDVKQRRSIGDPFRRTIWTMPTEASTIHG